MKLAEEHPARSSLAGHLPMFEHIDDVAIWAASACRNGIATAPRGQPTLEIFAQGFTLLKPRNRLISLRHRHWSAALAVGEFCWHMSRRDDVEPLAYYAPIWRSFSDDGLSVRGSCYGKKIFQGTGGRSPWETAKGFLQSDPETRRAVISVGGYDHLTTEDSLDVSCLQNLHFIIRNSKLNLIVNMRSNDSFIGLPYDIFLFSMFQDVMAAELNIEIGEYIHFADSLHIYERDIDKHSRVTNCNIKSEEMNAILDLDGLNLLIEFEENLRTNGISFQLPPTEPWRGMAKILQRFHQSHYGQDC